MLTYLLLFFIFIIIVAIASIIEKQDSDKVMMFNVILFVLIAC